DGQTSTLLPDGRALLLGGVGPNGPTDEALLQDLHTGRTSPLGAKLRVARAWHTATTLPDGTILILGGFDSRNRIVTKAELFDPRTNTFALLPSQHQLISARARHTATLLLDGSLL